MTRTAIGMTLLLWAAGAAGDELLGLPPVPVPPDNAQSAPKVALGDKLFNDTRFSSTGDVSCATCHDETKGFTDGPLATSEGINRARGTRNAPTVANAAYNETQFWDGRSPDLEDQSQHPFINPVEMGLADHQPILDVVRSDGAYRKMFRQAFDLAARDVTMHHVQQALAAFERTLVFGNTPWDRWYFGGEADAISDAAKRGFEVFLNDGRCVSCHVIEQDHALFTDHQFHNIGVGMNRIQGDVPRFVGAFLTAKNQGVDVDVAVLSNPDSSELGRFAVNEQFDGLGSFKTSTLRNIAVTAPYFHDGSAATLRDVVVHYNNGGVTNEGDPVNDFLSGGIRPLELTDQQIDDLVAFMESLTSPRFADQAGNSGAGTGSAASE
jgi:cytochrome c peroxidase